MEKIYLDEAIRQIKCICDQHNSDNKNRQPPFFFIVGAGVSSPSIKLASEIIEDCKKRVPDIKDPTPKNPIDQYSFWIEKAFPSQESRRRYFTELIAQKPITHAHLRFAHLLSKKKVANIVVTPNFDDLLERALWLFEKHHVTCDHPRTIERVDPLRDDIQLIHVHGNYLFYDIKNLKGELEERAKFAESEVSVVEKLSSIMSQYSPIIIGYSGWENDIIMTALKRTHNFAARNNIYWFCYLEEESNSLPLFIKNNPNVMCVIPKSEIKIPISVKTDSTDPSGNLPFKGEGNKDASQISTLDAKQVFDAFNTVFECGIPELTEDPLEFFINKLRHAVPMLIKDNYSFSGEHDLYSINMVIERISRAKECLSNQIQESEAGLNQILDAVRKADYKAALKIPDSLDISVLSEQQLDSFINATSNALSNIGTLSLEHISLLDEFIGKLDLNPIEKTENIIFLTLKAKANTFRGLGEFAEELIAYDQIIERFGESKNDYLQEQIAWSIINRGISLGKLDRIDDELTTYDQVIEKYGQSENQELQISIAWSLFNKGCTLGQLDRTDDELTIYDQVIEKYGQSENQELQIPVAWSFINKGYKLGTLNRTEEELKIYDRVLETYGQSENQELQIQVAKALFNKGVRLGQLDRKEEALMMYDQVVDRYEQSENQELQMAVAKALFNKGYRLGQLDRVDDELTTYDQVIEKYRQYENQELQILIAKALFNKGVKLGQLNRAEEALMMYDQVVDKYEQSENQELQIQVAKALFNKGVRLGQLDRLEEELTIYTQIEERYGKSENLDLQISVAWSLFNKGVTLGQLDREEEELITYDRILEKYGQSENQELQIAVAKSMYNKGQSLEKIGDHRSAKELYNEILKKFRKSKEKTIRSILRTIKKKGA